jgi:hypothetical protein
VAHRRRYRKGQEIAQKGKDGKRNRAFHRGPAQGRKDDKVLREVVSPAFARAEEDRAEVARITSEHRELVRDFEWLLASYAHSAGQCALAPLPAVLV